MKDEKLIESFLETQKAMIEEQDRMAIESLSEYLEYMAGCYGGRVVKEAIRLFTQTP
jgi:hypothetical protein